MIDIIIVKKNFQLYNNENIYNINELILFQKIILDIILATQQKIKKIYNKVSIIIN